MLRIKPTEEYNEDIRRLKRQGKNLDELGVVVDMLRREMDLPEMYSPHALWGEWAGFDECHIEGNWLLIYKRTNQTLHLARTGTHAELFRSWRGR